ncbi:MAG: hypothetical protein QJR08_04210 [Bacillota bacterium]|nr:hypothetical protein [Bacillota bacterium]
MGETRTWAFSNLWEYEMWTHDWCENCVHYVPGSEEGKGCPIEEAISKGTLWGDLQPVPDELEEIDLDEPGAPYRCTRFEERGVQSNA